MSELAINEAVAPPALRVLAIVSMLGEPATSNSASRKIFGQPVLRSTLERVAQATKVAQTIVLAWDDQVAAIEAAGCGPIAAQGPRRLSPRAAATAAALRWADGWRGGLLGTCIFDRGFDARAILAALDAEECDAALLVDPSSSLLDSATLELLVDHLTSREEQSYAFAPGTPGTGAMVLRRGAIENLEKQDRSPGSLLTYHPDRPQHDPLAKEFALVVPPRVARSSSRLTADSTRQVRRLSLLKPAATAEMIDALERQHAVDPLPREVVVELTTRRATTPVWSILSKQDVARPDLSLAQAKALFAQLAQIDDVRLTFGGVGDPLLHPQWQEIVEAARDAGIRAIHIETDLLPTDASAIEQLAGSEVDVVSVHLPAAHQSTYSELMGVDRMRQVLDHLRRFVVERSRRASGVPILAPTFVKCERNLGEMETWYDQWIRAVGAAVIAAPSDFGGRIDYAGVSDMTGGTRVACRRLASRMTILSDGTIASCEEDILGEQAAGSVESIADAWQNGLRMLRSLHDERRWDECTLCRHCKMWDRP